MTLSSTIRRIAWPLIGIICLMMLSCTRQLHTAEIIGAYSAQFPGGSQKLMISEGGKFVQEVLIENNSKRYLAKGTWKFDVPSQELILDNSFLSVLDGRGRLREDLQKPYEGIAVLGVEHPFGSITLGSAKGVL